MEVSGRLTQAGNVTLDGSGNGTVGPLGPWNSWNRWVVTSITVSTTQAATQTPYPTATIQVNGLTPAGSRGGTWTGNQDTWSGRIELGPADQVSIVFAGGVPGTIATARLDGTWYTRRS